MNIAEFLEARIAEDEAAIIRLGDVLHSPRTQLYVNDAWVSSPIRKGRLLAECAAKRAIIKVSEDVERMDYQISNEWGGDIDGTAELILRNLAAVYSDHPDYQQEWAQ